VRRRTWLKIALGSVAAPLAAYSAWQWRDEWFEKRLAVVVPGRIIRGAWQRPSPLRRILARERIRTILTLTAINHDDPKYVDQSRVVRETGVEWVFVPIRGSYASVDEMARAVEILADPARQPIFYHCVAGHHRSSQVQAAYRIAREGWSAGRAWAEVAALPWAKPATDLEDRRLIEAFASRNKDAHHAPSTVANPGDPTRLDLFVDGGRPGSGVGAPDLE
jgi:Tyrosine phosphatase family